jgi:predicted phosphodiesterase
MSADPHQRVLTRRQWLVGVGACAGAGLPILRAVAEGNPSLSFGLVTDVHSADIPPKTNRHYRDALEKLGQAVDTFRQRKAEFIIQLGDFIDADPAKVDDLGYLAAARKVWDRFEGPKYHVLGNHCVTVLSRKEFMDGIGWPGRNAHYSFDQAGWHFVVLDACYRRDETPYNAGNFDWKDSWVPAAEQQWLRDDLRKNAAKPTIVMLHQNLQDQKVSTGVKNADQVRSILEAAGNVVAVLQGHEHKGDYDRINGIHYVTFQGNIVGPASEGSTYAIVTLGPGRTIAIRGFGRESSRKLVGQVAGPR